MNTITKKMIVVIFVAGIFTEAIPSYSFAGWVDDWVSSTTNNGASYDSGAQRGYYSGGSFSFRTPHSSDHLFTVSAPKLKSGCGGIDAFMGGFSFMNADYLVKKFQKILSAAPAAAFDIALKTFVPQVAATIKELEAIASQLNALQLDDCKASKAMVATIANSAGMSSLSAPGHEGDLSAIQSDFALSSGITGLYKSVTDNWSNMQKGKVANDGTIKSTAKASVEGCPAAITAIFGGGSILSNMAEQYGMESSYVSLVRGFIGDVYITNPDETGSTYTSKLVAPCGENTNVENFISGQTQSRAYGGNCAPTADANADLVTYVRNSLESITAKIKSGTQVLSSSESAFLNSVPMSVGIILKTSIAAKTEDQTITSMSEVTAKAYAYYMLTELSTRISSLHYQAATAITSSPSSVDGKPPETCQLQIYSASSTNLDALTVRNQELIEALRASYAQTTQELAAIQTLVENMRKFDNVVHDELTKRFVKGLVTRVRASS